MSFDYDDIDELIDTDPIELGRRCRIAERQREDAKNASAQAYEQGWNEGRADQAERIAELIAERDRYLAAVVAAREIGDSNFRLLEHRLRGLPMEVAADKVQEFRKVLAALTDLAATGTAS
jgi:flagellar biosynthesis/type III secretory pathway protein FliH